MEILTKLDTNLKISALALQRATGEMASAGPEEERVVNGIHGGNRSNTD
jgi:hypothetical protein